MKAPFFVSKKRSAHKAERSGRPAERSARPQAPERSARRQPSVGRAHTRFLGTGQAGGRPAGVARSRGLAESRRLIATSDSHDAGFECCQRSGNTRPSQERRDARVAMADVTLPARGSAPPPAGRPPPPRPQKKPGRTYVLPGALLRYHVKM